MAATSENGQPLSDRRSSALQAAHEALADYPAIVAMHEEQTERAEAERDRLRAENEEFRVEIARQIMAVAERDSEIRRLRRAMHDAEKALTPGMRAGTADAKQTLGNALLRGLDEGDFAAGRQRSVETDENGETT